MLNSPKTIFHFHHTNFKWLFLCHPLFLAPFDLFDVVTALSNLFTKRLYCSYYSFNPFISHIHNSPCERHTIETIAITLNHNKLICDMFLPDAPAPTWEQLDRGLVAVKTVVHGLVDFIQNHSKKAGDPQQVRKFIFKKL